MSVINVKLKQRTSGSKYRKLVSTDDVIYPRVSQITSFSPYTPGAVLEDEEWFYVDNARTQAYAAELLNSDYETVDFDSLTRSDFGRIDFIFVYERGRICFQKVSKTKLVAKKSVLCFGENFQYEKERQELIISDMPDAFYSPCEDRLCFRRLESITGIFKGIDSLYREATDEEVYNFLNCNFISLRLGYDVQNVKTPNRKRIALAKATLDRLSDADRCLIFSYVEEYCPSLSRVDGAFKIGGEEDLKLLLYGIEQRFYTTPVGGEKRLANSVIPL